MLRSKVRFQSTSNPQSPTGSRQASSVENLISNPTGSASTPGARRASLPGSPANVASQQAYPTGSASTPVSPRSSVFPLNLQSPTGVAPNSGNQPDVYSNSNIPPGIPSKGFLEKPLFAPSPFASAPKGLQFDSSATTAAETVQAVFEQAAAKSGSSAQAEQAVAGAEAVVQAAKDGHIPQEVAKAHLDVTNKAANQVKATGDRELLDRIRDMWESEAYKKFFKVIHWGNRTYINSQDAANDQELLTKGSNIILSPEDPKTLCKGLKKEDDCNLQTQCSWKGKEGCKPKGTDWTKQREYKDFREFIEKAENRRDDRPFNIGDYYVFEEARKRSK